MGKMKRGLGILLALMAVACGPRGPWHKTAHGLSADGSKARVEVICYTPEIIRVVKSPLYAPEDLSASGSVVLKPGKVSFQVRETAPGTVELTTSALKVKLDMGSCTVAFYTTEGKLLTGELSDAMHLGSSSEHFRVCQSFSLEADEAVFGLGQHKGSGLNQHGKHWHLENVNTEIGIPLLHSAKGYALFWDNASPTEFHCNQTDYYFDSQAGEHCDYYLLYGGDADGVVRQIRTLTGAAPMNPLWAFGFHQSRERYVSQDELVSVVKRYRELEVPLDGIIQDWQYWGDHDHWNAVQFLNPQFPDPSGMMDEVHSLGAHALISVWPSFGPQTQIFKDLEAENLLLPQSTFPQGYGVRVYDPWNARARDIYWSYMEKYLWNAGLDGWWLDATEPEHQPVEPGDYDYKSPLGTYRALRNSFPLYSVGGVYDHQRALTRSRRVMILTRSATAGLQRYGAHVWSGDLVSSWESLRDQITSALNLSLCGIPYHNSDIGGFFCAETYPGGNRNPGFRKLYDRWMQLAVFTGMMRSHGTHTPREIFQFGERGNADFDIQESAIRLRYRLLPYIYSQAWKVTSKGASLMRPLFAEYPGTEGIEDEFLFGDRLLVAPVLREDDILESYLPEGDWVGFWNGMRFNGGVSFTRSVDPDIVPVFVKCGTVLPIGPDVQYAAEKPWDSLQIRVYTGADGDFTLYEDEGDGYAYEKGAFSTIGFHWDDASGNLTIGSRKGTFPGMLRKREFRVVLVRPDAGAGLDNESCDTIIQYTGNSVTLSF